MTRLNQGLFSTTMEAEKRDPGNEVASDSLNYPQEKGKRLPCLKYQDRIYISFSALTKALCAYGDKNP